MIKKETYTISQVLDNVSHYNPKEGKRYVEYDGDLIKMESQRYKLFKRDGTKCVSCGIQGTFFRKERDKKCPTYHFNLYAIDDNGNDVLITKDHILPKSKGGKNHMLNYQVLCVICNKAKGNKI